MGEAIADDLKMQMLPVTIERVRVRYEVAAKSGHGGPGCAASFGLWADILAALETASRFYEANRPTPTVAATDNEGGEHNG